MGIEITLNELEKSTLLLLSRVGSIQFRGLVDLQLFYGPAARDGLLLRYLLQRYHSNWFDTGLIDFRSSKGPFTYPRTTPDFPVNATTDQKITILQAKAEEELTNATITAEQATEEAEQRIHVLVRLGLLDLYDSEVSYFIGQSKKERWVRITPEGESLCERIEKGRLLIIRPRPVKRTTAFVACAFGYEEIDNLYESVLAPACRSVGCEPERVDLSEPETTITDAILQGIQGAAFVVADLTHARPSVYFEVGFANGMGVPLVLTCCLDHYRGTNDDERVHFDLEQYKISYWERAANGSFTWKRNMEPRTRIEGLVSADT